MIEFDDVLFEEYRGTVFTQSPLTGFRKQIA